METHSLRVVSSALSALAKAGTTLATTWLGITMAMAIAIPVSITKGAKARQ